MRVLTMKISALSMDNPAYDIAVHSADSGYVYSEKSVNCEAAIKTTGVYIGFNSAKDKYRPYLAIMGEVEELQGDFPVGIKEMTFDDIITRPRVEYMYNFTDEELSYLAGIGLYQKGFKVPDVFYENQLNFPVKVDYAVVSDKGVPLVFVNIQNPYNNEVDGARSGYAYEDETGKCIGLASYFEPITKEDYQEFIESTDDFISDKEMKSIQNDDDYLGGAYVSPETPETDEPEAEPVVTEEDELLTRLFESSYEDSYARYNKIHTSDEYSDDDTDDVEAYENSDDAVNTNLVENDDTNDIDERIEEQSANTETVYDSFDEVENSDMLSNSSSSVESDVADTSEDITPDKAISDDEDLIDDVQVSHTNADGKEFIPVKTPVKFRSKRLLARTEALRIEPKKLGSQQDSISK